MRMIAVAAGLAMMVGAAQAQQLSPDERAKIDAAVNKSVASTHVPSVSVGVARGGQVIYAQAFGDAVLPERAASSRPGGIRSMLMRGPVPADASMAYPVGSISKQFTAACILLLQERGKLTLDDPISKWFPEFTRANQVTVRNLLTHTSGYSDYAPQDYTIPAWTKPIVSYVLIHEWATKPLDFDPGTRWQYSNTNFQMAALIIEKATGQKYHDFLWDNVIMPLKLQGVLDLDNERDRLQVHGYEQHALGPMRPAILEAPGWYTGDGGLAMPVSTLLQWDESIVHRTLLKPGSYDAMEKDYTLKDGTPSHYGLGVFVREAGGKHLVYHSGEVGGFVSNNVIDLDDDVSYAALTNFEGPGASVITSALRPILIPALVAPSQTPPAKPEESSLPHTFAYDSAAAAQAKTMLDGLQNGKLDRSLFTADTNYYFNPVTLSDFQASLQPLGPVESVTQTAEELRGGMIFRVYAVKFATRTLALNTYTQKDGKIEQFLVSGRD